MITEVLVSPAHGVNEVEITYADAVSSGYGHKKITVEVNYNGQSKRFNAVTSCMPEFDRADELEGQERYYALYSCVASSIDELVADWIFFMDYSPCATSRFRKPRQSPARFDAAGFVGAKRMVN